MFVLTYAPTHGRFVVDTIVGFRLFVPATLEIIEIDTADQRIPTLAQEHANEVHHFIEVYAIWDDGEETFECTVYPEM